MVTGNPHVNPTRPMIEIREIWGSEDFGPETADHARDMQAQMDAQAKKG